MTLAAPTLQERVARRLDYVRARQDLQRDLERLLASANLTPMASRDVRVGLAALSSGPWHLTLQLLLGHALRLRGAATQLLLCDLPELPICNERLVTSHSQEDCDGCLEDKRELLEVCGLSWDRLGAFTGGDAVNSARSIVASLSDQELRTYRAGPWPIGEWLDVSASHYLRRDGSGNDGEQIAVLRRLLTSAIVTVEGVDRWLDRFRPSVVIVQGGVHFMWRIVFELARARGIAVVCREMGKGGWDHHLYALNRDSMAPDLDDEWRTARVEPLTPREAGAVDTFLDQLPARTFAATPAHGSSNVRVRSDQRTVVAFTNVTWDMATARRDAGFAGLADWLQETLRICAALPNVHLIIRAHPAEAGNTREHVIDDVVGRLSHVPASVTLVPPTDSVSVSALLEEADLVTVYNSTAGLEAAARGKRVLVSGRPHFRERGFTIDVDSRPHYRSVLQSWSSGTGPATAENAADLARRYVHMFYLRYHVPMGWTTSPLEPPFALTIRSLRELAAGSNPVLDVVCDAIINQRQVLLPRNMAGAGACAR